MATKGPRDDDLAKTRETHSLQPRLVLLAAADAVIREKGFADATVSDIADRAGVTADVFHAHFSGKGALLRALCERWVEQLTTVTNEATRSGLWATAATAEIIDLAVRSAMDAVLDNAPLLRAVLAHSATDPALPDALRKIGSLLSERVVKVIRDGKLAGWETIDERQVSFCLLTAIALAHHAVLVGADSTGTAFDRVELANEASRAIGAYLDTALPAEHRSGKVPPPGNIPARPRV